MRIAVSLPMFLLLIACLCQCRQADQEHRVYREADSLLNLTLELQSRIASPEIRRLHEFQEEINGDLKELAGFEGESDAYEAYRGLSEGLGQCVQVCNQFHEEVFLLESSLRDIMEQLETEETDPRDLEDILRFEMENYRDLKLRIDSSIELAIRQAELFYTLKPKIDRLREQWPEADRKP